MVPIGYFYILIFLGLLKIKNLIDIGGGGGGKVYIFLFIFYFLKIPNYLRVVFFP